MAVEAPDKDDRENPVRNFIKGTSGDHKIKWVKAVAPDGSVHRLNSDNTSDWQLRGPGWRVEGPWVEESAVEEEESEEEDDDETEDDTDTKNSDPTTQGDPGTNPLEHLHKLRAEATELGVTVNEQWGMRRLNQEIASAKLRKKLPSA